MRRVSVLLVALVLAGCSALPFTQDDADEFRVPLVCLPKHTQLPCARGVEQGVGYQFNLQTHCGIDWAYFDGRYWTLEGAQAKPPDWAGITAGRMVLSDAALRSSTPISEAALALSQPQPRTALRPAFDRQPRPLGSVRLLLSLF